MLLGRQAWQVGVNEAGALGLQEVPVLHDQVHFGAFLQGIADDRVGINHHLQGTPGVSTCVWLPKRVRRKSETVSGCLAGRDDICSVLLFPCVQVKQFVTWQRNLH